MKGWVAVDLDGTLAHYSDWNDGEVGEPIEPMLARVKRWLSEGRDVRIFTARVAETRLHTAQGVIDGRKFAREQRRKIEAWCVKHLGRRLPVTATKDFQTVEIWDDRAVRVISNTGQPCCCAVRAG